MLQELYKIGCTNITPLNNSLLKAYLRQGALSRIHVHFEFRKMPATYLLTHTFQHTLFDWLKFTWDPQKVYRTHMI